MLIGNKFKLLLSKIRLAQGNKKKILKVKLFSVDLLFLDVLWRYGVIYGYNKIKNKYIIFLKYSLRGSGMSNTVTFFDFILTTKQLKTLLILNPHNSYLVLTCKGISILLKKNSVAHGGIVIAEL